MRVWTVSSEFTSFLGESPWFLFPVSGLLSLAEAAVINCSVALLGASQQQRSIGCSRDFIRTNTGAVLHPGAACRPHGEQQLRTLSCCLPVPAQVGGGGRSRGGGGVDSHGAGGAGGGGSVQQGAVQGGVLPDSHLDGGGWQGGGSVLPTQTFNNKSET